MAKPRVFTKEEAHQRKIEAQRKRRAEIKEINGTYSTWIKLSDEQKAINKEIRKERQREWIASEVGQAFIKKQSERNRKYASVEERIEAQNARTRERMRTDLDANLKNRVSACKSRSKKDSIPFDLDFEYIKSIYQDTCPYLGIKLNLRASSGDSMDALSIDKIIPSLGYVKGNVQVISYKANVMKQDVDLDTLRLFAKRVLEIHGDN